MLPGEPIPVARFICVVASRGKDSNSSCQSRRPVPQCWPQAGAPADEDEGDSQGEVSVKGEEKGEDDWWCQETLC